MATLARRLSIFLKPPAPVSRALDLRSIVSGAVRLLRVLVRESISLSIQLADQPVHVLGDEHQLEQVLMNVVLNAADAQPNGGTIEIRVFADERRLTPTAQGMAAVIQVVDGGRGIPEHVLPHLFKQPTSSKDASIATGLGLPVSAEILHRMEGHIDVTSERGRGTTVEMVLPLRN
jgi:signal transduction histidine kinase